LIKELKNFIDEYIQQKKLFKTDIAGFTMKTYQWTLNYYILQQLKKINKNIRTIIGGINYRSQGLEFMKAFKEVDFAIWGEGEIPLLKLIQNIDDPSSYQDIPNLIYRKKDKIISTYPIKGNDLPDINTYPFANHDDYFETTNKLKLNIHSEIPIWGVRSCHWNRCKFCVLNEYIYRERKPDNIVKEIEYQAKKYKIDKFMFVDLDLGRNKRKDFDELLELLLKSSDKRGRPYHLGGEISPLRLDRKSLPIMKKITFDHVQIGFEATSDSLLKKMNKKQRFVHNIQALKLSKEHDLPFIGLNIIRGIPTETTEDVIESIKNLKFLRFLLDIHSLRLIELVLYKGSPFFNELSKKQREEWDFSLYWDEFKNLDFLSKVDKYEFLEFVRRDLVNSQAWKFFEIFLKEYQSNKFSYNWVINSDGTSIIKEKGEFILDKNETKILKFCDTIKTFSELKEHFPGIKENDLRNIISPLKEVGLLYFDDDFKRMISIVSTSNINKKMA
jgi:radical SAM superfamily enzyme YgiQ (UPF0313 family)